MKRDPTLSLAPFFALSLTLVLRCLLRNQTETLATHANCWTPASPFLHVQGEVVHGLADCELSRAIFFFFSKLGQLCNCKKIQKPNRYYEFFSSRTCYRDLREDKAKAANLSTWKSERFSVVIQRRKINNQSVCPLQRTGKELIQIHHTCQSIADCETADGIWYHEERDN